MPNIQKATLADAAVIMEIARVTWLDTYGARYSEEERAHILAVWLDPTNLAAAIEDPQGFIALARNESGTAVGVISGRLENPSPPRIGRLYVLPEHQRQGIGVALLQVFVAACPDSRVVVLDVQAGNLNGFNFWVKQGFTETRLRDDSVAGITIRLIEMQRIVESA